VTGGRPLGRTLGAVLWTIGLAASAGGRVPAAPSAHVDEICHTLTDDSNYKVRVQAALVLGKIGDARAVQCLSRALADQNKAVRALSAQALGQIGDAAALEPLRALAKRDPDPFVRNQTEKALALLAGPGGGGKRAKMYLNFGPFTGGLKSAAGDPVKIVHDTLEAELGKLPMVTLTPTAGGGGKAAAGGGNAFWIDGNITRLDDVASAGSSETSCGVKVMVARWPSKSIISWTSAEATVQAGARPRDRENARRECLEATAGQLAEDLAKFLKAQGG
jgi:hypothetical protein